MKLETSILSLTGVGPKMAEKLKRLGIENIRDLLFYFPRSWDDFSKPRKIASLRINEDVIIKAKIFQIKQNRTRRRWMSIIEALLVDDSGEIKAIWFNQPFLMNVLKPGEEWLFAGKVNWDYQKKQKTLTVTQYENPSADGPVILSVYPEIEGLTSKFLRRLIKPLLTAKSDTPGVSEKWFGDYLPDWIINLENLIDLNTAIKNIHFPIKTIDIEVAKKRLAFDELFLIGLKMLVIKKELQKSLAPKMEIFKKDLKKFTSSLPFKLTNAQRKTAWEIIQDLNKKIPMNRLLEGDVGSGKTVVAAMAVLSAAKNNFQSVWLAPTEILANQHYINISKLLKSFKIKVGLLTSANKKADLKNDDLIIGTHAILQKDVHISNLGLIIIDEQHRFGVKQRAHLRQSTDHRLPSTDENSCGCRSSVVGKQIIPHLLSMTATPIPRTLALSVYGDLDLSIINEMPVGRQKVLTKVINAHNRDRAYRHIREQIRKGRQGFVICPLIKPKDVIKINLFDADRKSAVKEYEKLSKEIFPDLRIGLMHGKMKPKEKDETMKKFTTGKIDILVSTAVVEVGIDIANATVMMIESAERFGLAQLHQFRGRVGRGEHQSYCFLFAEAWSENTKQRLNAMVTCHNGFELAEKDLEIRGPGELSGLRQSGLPDLKMASLSDTILIKKARSAAEGIIKDGIEKYPKLQEKLAELVGERHLE